MPDKVKKAEAVSETVVLAACSDYRETTLNAALDRLLEPLSGSVESLAAPGARVLIKPNLLSDHVPEDAVTTHPELARGVIRRLRSAGYDVAVADSPASAVKLDRVWERTGFRALCEDENVPLLNLEKSGSRRFDVDGFRFSIAQPILDAAAIVNLPKVKTHTLTTLTCGVKNMYGAVPGYAKAQLHKLHPTPASFGRLLRAIYSVVSPALTLADGVVGMEGEGPGNGTPVNLGFLAASADAEVLDLALCDLLGLPPASVPYLKPMLEAGPVRTIRWAGDDPDSLRPAVFRKPRTLRARLIPERIVRWLSPWIWIRPLFNERCIRCGRCVEACPVEALALKPGDLRPALNPGLCMGCCCCHEICPAHAIAMRQSALPRLWGAFKEL